MVCAPCVRAALHRVRVGGVGHHPVAALAAQGEGGGQLLIQQEGVDVLVPEGAHHPAGQVQLDVIHAVLDLLPHRVDEAVWTVALAGVAGREEVAAGGGEEDAAGEHAGSLQPARRERVPPGHVHEVARAAAPDADHTGLGHAAHQVLAEAGRLLCHRDVRIADVVRMNVDVPQPGQQVRPLQVDHPRPVTARRAPAARDLRDASVLHDHARPPDRLRVDAIDQRGVRKHKAHSCLQSRLSLTGPLASGQAATAFRPVSNY